MAVSGNQLTRFGAYLLGVGKKLVILAKEAASLVDCNIDVSTLLSNAPTDNATLLAENTDGTTTLTSLIDISTFLSDNPTDNFTLLQSYTDSTTTLCKA